MSGDVTAPLRIRQSRRCADTSGISDLTALVTVPGRPDAVRAFTEAEAGEAARYAADTGGNIVALPPPAQPPDHGGQVSP